MTFLPGNLYHTGYVVADLDESVERLGRLGVTRWTPPKTHALTIEFGGRRLTERLRYVYSADGPHRLELIEPLGSGGYLAAAGAMTFHHLGFWVDDIEAAVQAAPDWGLTLETKYLDEQDRTKVSYHLDSAGMRYELVPISHKPIMEQRWALARGE